MGHHVQGSVAVASAANGWTACLYHLREFFNTNLPANYDGRISIVASSPGSGGVWSKAGVTDDAYIVVEMDDPWTDATNWQVLFTARDTISASTVGTVLGAVAIPGHGLWAGLSPKGGWDDVTKTFGAELFSGLRHILGRASDAAGAAQPNDTVMNFGFMDRVTDEGEIDNGAIFAHLKVGVSFTGSFLAGAFTPVNSTRAYPCMLVAGTPNPTAASTFYGYSSAGNQAASIPANDLSTFQTGYVDNSTGLDGELLDEFGEYVGYPLLWVNATLLKVVGWFDALARIDTAVASGSTFDTGMKWGNSGLAWPWGTDNPTV